MLETYASDPPLQAPRSRRLHVGQLEERAGCLGRVPRRLAGMARVVWLSTVSASRRLKDELVAQRWRPRDSPETVARFGTQRTWAGSDGKRKLFRRHITLGHGVDTQRCAQIYYDVCSDGSVEVAWVGEHRPTVSEDT